MKIESTSNPSVKDVVRLREKRRRHDATRFVIEGARLADRAIEAGVAIDAAYVRDGGAAQASHYPNAVFVSDKVMAKMSGRQNPPEVIAVGAAFALDPPIELADDEWWMALAGIEKPGNLGAMLRTAAALGVTGILLVDPRCDLFGPNVVRNSMGALFSVPIVELDFADVSEFAAARTARIVAAVSRKGVEPWNVDMAGAVIVAIGSEADGLPQSWIGLADELVTIPMEQGNGVDSLNASVSAAIVLAEAKRQRSLGGSS